MKKILFSSFLLFCLAACNNEDKKETPPESGDDVNAAINFINAALKGNFRDAKTYVVRDSTNLQFLDARERIYNTMNSSTKLDYANSSMRVFGVSRLNDSTTIIVYANSFKNDKDTLKVIRDKNNWLVDVKYIWEHDEDSIELKSRAKPDTLRQ